MGDSMEAREKPTNDNGDSKRFTPPTIAVSTVPLRMASVASAKATIEDEHAVSAVRLGPRMSRL